MNVRIIGIVALLLVTALVASCNPARQTVDDQLNQIDDKLDNGKIPNPPLADGSDEELLDELDTLLQDLENQESLLTEDDQVDNLEFE